MLTVIKASRPYIAMLAVVMFLTSYSNIEPNNGTPVLSDHQKSVIEYFKEIALGSEFGTEEKITRKWKGPMKIFLGGSPSQTLKDELSLIVDELNALISDDFRIEIVDKQSASNFYIFFGQSSEYAAIYPAEATLARGNSGVFHIYWNNQNQITKGHIFVKVNRKISVEEQRHVLREELTQSLGLPRDSALYPESIFQQNWTIPTHYAEIDKELIHLLYHPKMMTGLSAPEVEAVLTQILLSGENI
jgi:hypothetical protein